jgi:hypothetical protein
LRKLKTDEKSSVFTILACLVNLNDANLYSFKVYRPRRARPLARRAAITARPPFVFMRTKKPCVRARRVFDGW